MRNLSLTQILLFPMNNTIRNIATLPLRFLHKTERTLNKTEKKATLKKLVRPII